MALTLSSAKLSELPLNSSSSSPLSLTPLPRSSTLFLSHSSFPFPTLTSTPFSSLRTTHNHSSSKSNLSAPWLTSSDPSPKRVTDSTTHDPSHNPTDKGHFHTDKGLNAVERIVLRLRNLGLTPDEEKQEEEEEAEEGEAARGDVSPVTGEERLGDLLKREWVRPDAVMLVGEDKVSDEMVLPWERERVYDVDNKKNEQGEEGDEGLRKRPVKVSTLAERTLKDGLLRRLKREMMSLTWEGCGIVL